MFAMPCMIVMVVMMTGIGSWVALTLWRQRSPSGACWHCLRPLDDLVEFSSIQPYTTTFRAIINFNALPFGHDKVGFDADGTFHR
jgi:hypothetical protein